MPWVEVALVSLLEWGPWEEWEVLFSGAQMTFLKYAHIYYKNIIIFFYRLKLP